MATKPDAADPVAVAGSDTAAATDDTGPADTAADTDEDTAPPPNSPEQVALLTGGPEELHHVHVSDTLLDGGPAVVLGSQVTYPDIDREPGDVVIATATTGVYRYPAHGETLLAADAAGDGTSEPLLVDDIDGDGFDDLLLGTWAGVVSSPNEDGSTAVVGSPSLSLVLGPLAAGAPLPAPAWTTELTGGYSLVAARGPAPDGVGTATYVEDRIGIHRVEPGAGTLESNVSRAEYAESLVAADLDGDGLGDLARTDGNTAYVCLGPWDDVAREGGDPYWYTGLTPRDLVAGDFDQDGTDELALATTAGVWLLPLEGGGAVDASDAPRLDASERFDATRLAVGDADEDGGDDLLIADRYVGDEGSAWLVRGPVSVSLDLDAGATRLIPASPGSLGAALAFGPEGDLLVGTRWSGEVWIFGAL